MRTEIILCGGRSRRFGKDKALLTIGRTPIIRRMADRISRVVDEIIIAGDSAQRESFAAVSAVSGGAKIVCDQSSPDKVVFIPTGSLRSFDPDLRTFLNVNYPEDLWDIGVIT